jgi:hypothetical protein
MSELPPGYIDPEHKGRDLELLEVFYKACQSEGGTADEIHLRGLKAITDFETRRLDRLQKENHRFREPECTILCDILANGTLLPDPNGSRYGQIWTEEEFLKAAFTMGQAGAPPSESERLAFEEWMRGHSWSVEGVWNGVTYDDREHDSVGIDIHAMQTRMLWAAWRDRAALSRLE